MSFAGHIYDMLRRDKENRELRQHLRGRMAANRNGIIGSYSNREDIHYEELDRIQKDLKKKRIKDELRLKKDMGYILIVGAIVAVLLIYLMLFV